MATALDRSPRSRASGHGRRGGSFAVLLVALVGAACGATPTEPAGDAIVDATAVAPRAASGPASSALDLAASPAPAVGGATASPTAAPSTVLEPVAAASAPSSAPPPPPRKKFAMNLYRAGDYVSQYTFEWCVGASLQMALNMTTDKSYTTRSNQERLWEMAHARSDSPFGGANPRGWTAALNDLGVGPYTLVSIPTYDEALRVAATALRATKRPVGLVMWRGRHAWVMSGFESIGDPAKHDDARITGIRVLDPLYPYGSKTWGSSPKPNTLVTPKALARQFVVRDRGRVDLGVPPGYLLILPTA
jgi:hypothetical protein